MEEKNIDPEMVAIKTENATDTNILTKNNEANKLTEKGEIKANETPSNEYMQHVMDRTSNLLHSTKEFKKRFQKYIPNDRFTWPDNRGETENAIVQLKERQILIVRGINSDWFNWAPQRIASVLQASRNKLWPGCAGVYRVKDEERLEFGFWKTFEKFDKPTIIVLPGNVVMEYVRNLIIADYDKAYFDFKEALKVVNIYLVVMVPDNDDTAEILKKEEARKLLKDVYANWVIVAIKLELQRKKGRFGAELYEKIIKEYKPSGRNERKIFNIINEEDIDDDEKTLQVINEEIQMENTASDLITTACKEPTELKLRLIYCGTFFNELTPADFNKIAGYLLNNQNEEIRSVNGKYVEYKPLNDIWLKPSKLDNIMTELMLTTKHTGKVRRIGFNRHVDIKDLKIFFLEKKYNIFLTFTEELIKQDLLFNNSLSEELKNAFIKIITIVVQDNYTNYDGDWLYNTAIDQAIKVYSSIHDEQTLKMIELSERILDTSILRSTLKPLQRVLKELLLSGQEHLTLVVKQFFEKLMASSLKKNVAIGLAIDLYNELQDTGNFPQDELDKYFRQALNVRDFEEKFYAYRMMVNNLNYKELFNKTSEWLTNDPADKEPWTKKFSWLYKLDFCILTFHIHFQLNKAEKEYELFSTQSERIFSDDFKQLLENITSEKCLTSWHELLHHEDLFKYKFELLEETVTDISKLEGREDDQNRTPLSLAGDVLENWFYILYLKAFDDNSSINTGTLKEYTALLNNVVDPKRLTDLESYWRRKAKYIYSDTITKYKYDDALKEKEREDKIEKLKKRRNGVDMLTELI